MTEQALDAGAYPEIARLHAWLSAPDERQRAMTEAVAGLKRRAGRKK